MSLPFRLFALIVLAGLPGLGAAADIPVNALDDPSDDPALCSLREAIASAVANVAAGGCVAGEAAGEDRVLVDPSLFSGDPLRAAIVWDGQVEIAGGSLALVAPSGTRLELQGGASGQRAFWARQNAGEHLRLEAIELVGFGGTDDGESGWEGGGAILLDGEGALLLQDCRLAENTAPALGGAVAIVGSADRRVDIRRCVIEANQVNAGNGGALGGRGARSYQVQIEESLFVDNLQQASAFSINRTGGGALYLIGPMPSDPAAHSELSIRASRFVGNQAMLRGGAIWLPNLRSLDPQSDVWNVLIEDSVFEANDASFENEDDVGQGGAIWIDGSWHGQDRLSLSRNAFIGNAAIDAGALAVTNAVNLDATNNQFLDNHGGGAVYLGNSANAPAVTARFIANSFAGNEGSAFWFNLFASGDQGAFAGNLISRLATQSDSIDTCVWQGNVLAWTVGATLHDDPGDSCAFGSETDYLPNLMLAVEPVQLGAHQQRLAPQPGSPAIDAWNDGDCLDLDGQPLSTDLTGLRRIDGLPIDGDGDLFHDCDLGAVEYGSVQPVLDSAIFRDGFEDVPAAGASASHP